MNHKPRHPSNPVVHHLLPACAIQLLIATSIIIVAVTASTTTTSVKLGFVDVVTGPGAEMLLGIKMGTEAAVARANREGGVHDRPLEVVRSFSTFSEEDYANQVQNIVNTHPDVAAMTGMLISGHIKRSMPILRQHNIPNLAPMISDPQGRGYDPLSFFISPDPWAEIVGMVNQAVSKFRIKRIGFMYTKYYYGTSITPYGETHRKVFYKLMDELGLEVVGEYVYDSKYYMKQPTTFDPVNATTDFLLKKPEAVFMFAAPADPSPIEFIMNCLLHPLAPKLKFFLTEPLAIIAPFAVMQAKKISPDLNIENRIYSTFTFPLPTDMSYAIVQEYHADMAALFGTAYLRLDFTAIAGYVSTRFAVRALRRAPRPLTRQGILDTLHESSIWEIADLTYGIFKGDCKRKGETFCRCNEGAHLIDIGAMDATFQWQKVPNASFEWDYTKCSGSEIKLRPPTNYLQLFDASSPSEAALAALLRLGKEGAESTSALNPKIGDVAEQSPGSDASATVKELNNSLLVTTLAHSVLGERAIDEASLPWPLIDPFEPKATLALPFRKKVLHIHATLQQEFHAFAAHAAEIGATEILLVADAGDVEAMMVPFEKSATTFRIGSRSVASLSDVTGGSYVVLCGVSSASDAASVINALKAKPALRVGVAAAEFHAQYAAFAAEDASKDVRSRLLTATNLPHWGPAGAAASPLVSDYHSSVGGAANAHPVSLRSFVATRALLAVLDYLPGKVTPETVLGTWYDVSIIFADNSVVLGPYFRTACSVDGANADTCECNRGARKLHIFSFDGLLNGTDTKGEKDITLGSCQIAYTRPVEESALSAGAIAGVAVAAVAILAMAILAGLSMMGGKQRDTRYAPKDPSQPFTLVFTDIQSSTSLWARIPDEMGPALDTHHEIIRKLINKHRGYEVKTIGDAFMIAFEDADDAVDLCEALQQSFFEHDWGTNAIDETYKQLEQEAVEEDPTTDKAISCKLPAALYGKMWNGLRVRCGVHTGMGDIKLDEITQGYDYYGNVPNVAARTEAIGNGGQICVTSFAVNSLRKERSTSDLGPVDLRGVTDAVIVHQVDGVAGRKFAGLRIDKGLEEADLTSETEDELGSVANSDGKSAVGETASMFSNMSLMKNDDCNLREALLTMFGTMDVDVRRSTLGKIGNKWRVAPKSKKGDKAAECKELIRGISNRLLGVLRSKKKQLRGTASIKSGSTRQSNANMSLQSVTSGHRNSLGHIEKVENNPKLRGLVSPTLLSPSNDMSPHRTHPNMVPSSEKYTPSD